MKQSNRNNKNENDQHAAQLTGKTRAQPPEGANPELPAAGAENPSLNKREEALPQTSPEGLPTMAESVTRHAQIPPASKFQFLLCGIDTLDLGLYVIWDMNWEKIKTLLEAKKEAAKGTTGLLCSSEDCRDFLFLPGGKPPNYRYHLQFPEYHIYIAISEHYGSSPNVYVSINSEVLWHEGISTILELLDIDLGMFGGIIRHVQPSRCDLCVDFKLDSPLTYSFLEILRVSRSRKVRMISNGNDLETYYCGSPDSPVQARIYNKGLEIMKSNKQWFLPLWGLDDPDGVWRVEFQLRRTFLKQYKINTLDDLWHKIGAIWEYLTGEWFSLRYQDKSKSERCTVHPWWLAVQECRERFGDMSNARRTFTSDALEPIQHTLAHIIGRLISIAAQSGIKDRKEAIEHLCRLLYKGTNDDKFTHEYRKRSVKLGYRGKRGGSDHEES
jgi:hypothetical protein